MCIDNLQINCVLQDEDEQGLTDEEVQAEANTFMFAGEMKSALCGHKSSLQPLLSMPFLKTLFNKTCRNNFDNSHLCVSTVSIIQAERMRYINTKLT